MMQRACAAALLHKGKTIINNPGTSRDDKAAINIIQQLGAKVTVTENRIEVISSGVAPVIDHISCGESGLSARLFTPIAALSDKPIRVEGEGSLLQRPMNELGHILPELGVRVNGFTGKLPFDVQGPLQARTIKIDGSVSSQYLSGLLFAYCFSATTEVLIKVDELASTPYIDMTLQVLEHFGRPVRREKYHSFFINPALFTDAETVEITIEGDWSSAAAFLVAGAIAGEVSLEGLDTSSLQADRFIMKVLDEAGAAIVIDEGRIKVSKSRLKPIEFDLSNSPDIFPLVAILACHCDGESYIKGMHRLWHKESNRAESIAEMLLQFEVFFSIEDDVLCVTGNEEMWACYIDSYNDHRIVMAAAIGALGAGGVVVIDNVESVNKSYPAFFEDLMSLGVNCSFKSE
jgi:3-phosphoshikimate 1-carboxyvinyltransferase